MSAVARAGPSPTAQCGRSRTGLGAARCSRRGSAVSLLIGRDGGGPTFGFGGPELARRDPHARFACRERCSPLLVGGTLGLCGAALQGLLRNPLAEPGLLGASSGAAFGAVHDVLFRPRGRRVARCCRSAPSRARCWRSRRCTRSRDGAATFLTIVLAGIAINALAAALTSLALNFAPSPYAALEILFWMLGSLADRSLAHVVSRAAADGAGLAAGRSPRRAGSTRSRSARTPPRVSASIRAARSGSSSAAQRSPSAAPSR